MTAAITIAASVGSGRYLNSPVRNSSVMTASTAATMPDIWVLAPAPPLTAVFERLPPTTMPPERPEPRFAAPRPISSRLALDLVAVAGGEALGRSQPLDERQQHDRERVAREVEIVLGGDVRQPELR